MSCRHHPNLLALVSAGVLLSLTASAVGAGSRLHISELDEHQTRYFHFYTNLPPAEARPYLEQLDLTFAEFDRLLASFETRRRYRRQSVFLLATRADYNGLMRSFGKRAEHSGGMYFQGETHRRSGVATYVGHRKPERVMGTLRHELFHLFNEHRLDGRLPTWLNEGFAEYFERAVWVEGEGLQVGLADVGSVHAARAMVRNGTYQTLSDLLDVSGKAWTRSMRHDMGGGTQSQYLQSWSLVQFFMHGEGGRYTGAFGRFLRDLAKGRSQRLAFRDAFGADYAAAERAWAKATASMDPDRLSIARAHLQAMAWRMKDANVPAGTDPAMAWESMLSPASAPASPMLGGNWEFEERSGWRSSMNYLSDEGTWVAFEVVPAENPAMRLPPALVTRQLTPQVRLRWERNAEGDLQYEIVFEQPDHEPQPAD